MRRYYENDQEELINLTPLLDVLFVVLILFILVAPMLELDRIELVQATEQRKDLQEPSPIKIVVDANDAIKINGMEVALSEVQMRMSLLKKTNSHAIPQLFHDKKARFGTYQSIKNQIEASGFEQLDVVLKK
ncbi:MAG: biopolymer transporter ExbD [Simkaniaceae bacterium]|nr:biopolymer transporter ExbD [Simkaniaceae bacterium]